MRQPEVTKLEILHKAGTLFNIQGYNATSISDITEATGYTKGAIYRHFGSKEGLEGAALEYLFSRVDQKIVQVIKNEDTAPKKLKAVLRFFNSYTTSPFVEGGCPLLNSAIEVDDNNAKLREISNKMLDRLKTSLETILMKGVKYKQIKEDVDTESLATLMLCSLEGGIMSSKLSHSNRDINIITNYLSKIIDQITIKE